ncbi:7-carboxy-7-deazaguanine synthase QueE [Methanococcus voltae]|uniref:7-carboxy-7-deazaguanine synthase n=1 Tax=Methanococcus voltae TaxID=2188 RepID=A0A8J7S5E5_METVO|nr:7-carboxy-7-deazaguanine synthase QueE [Methanococcus voltae]MBP2172735.1 organic radical activating enzyme [Methanococcus voltae]MBP2201855.1 organic radical activating enzyme [Methanococcus voltae]
MIREVFSSIMGEGKYIGKRFIFVRFKKCPLNCIYCDEPNTSKGVPQFEYISGSGIIEEIPDLAEKLVENIEKIKTPDLFAVSFTGGEPLVYSKYIQKYAKELREKGYKTFLESNGMFPEAVKDADYYDYASIDIKLPEHFDKTNKVIEWEELYNKELETIANLYKNGTEVYAKVVIFEDTSNELIEKIARDISKIGNITLCIQPITPIEGLNIKPPAQKKIFEIMELCGKYVDVMFTPQIHKWMNML